MVAVAKPRVLCVDDEPNVLEGLALSLRRPYEVVTAPGGAAGLELLERDPSIAVVLSDMRMPGMNGAVFLARARELRPDAVRMLLTGHSDVDAAIAAINDGGIFRFLTKPCPPPVLLGAFAAANEQNRLATAERVLLEQTLRGAIKTLTDVLSLVAPAAFGRATRIRQVVCELADALELRERWQVEVAAMLSQLGCITLPAATAERLYFGRPLSPEEQKQVERVPAMTEQLLGNIPRMEIVQDILASMVGPGRAASPTSASLSPAAAAVAARGAAVLRVAVEFDALESATGGSAELALGTLRGRGERYAPDVLQALFKCRGLAEEVRELPLSRLRVGMILADDVRLRSGVLLVARGYEITLRFLERVQALPPSAMDMAQWRVVLRGRWADGAGD